MRLNRTSLGTFALLLVALPVWAAHTYTTEFDVIRPTTIGNTELKPGNYVIKVQDGQSQLQVLHDGKMVAEVPCHWIQLPTKAAVSEVDVDSNNKVTGVEYAGKTAALDFK